MNLEEKLKAYKVIVHDEYENEVEVKLDELLEVGDLMELIESHVAQQVKEARIEEHKIAMMRDPNYTQAEWDLMEKVEAFYPGNLKRLMELQGEPKSVKDNT